MSGITLDNRNAIYDYTNLLSIYSGEHDKLLKRLKNILHQKNEEFLILLEFYYFDRFYPKKYLFKLINIC